MFPAQIPMAPFLIVLAGCASLCLVAMVKSLKHAIAMHQAKTSDTSGAAMRARAEAEVAGGEFRQQVDTYQSDRKRRTFIVSVTTAAVSGLIALSLLAFLAVIMTTHESRYSEALHGALTTNYDVVPLEQAIEPGVAFDAEVAGTVASCVVTVPDLLTCDNAVIEPR